MVLPKISKLKKSTVKSHINSCCINDKNRYHYNVRKNILFKLDDGRYEKYDIRSHGHTQPPSIKPTRKPRESEIPITVEVCPEEIKKRVTALCSDFAGCLKFFNKTEEYTGPSVYFHLETVESFHEMDDSVPRAAKDQHFCELLYATLVSWGMHRMDKGAKMPDFKTFADSIAGLAPEIEELSRYRITDLPSQDTPFILGKLWSLITRLQGSMTKSKLVANSKILHHLLPHLVPSIDRANTAIFFGCNIQGREKKALGLIFPQMVCIAQNVKLFLNSFDYEGFNSSETKLIDNAIIGYLFKHNLKPKKHGNEQRSVS